MTRRALAAARIVPHAERPCGHRLPGDEAAVLVREPRPAQAPNRRGRAAPGRRPGPAASTSRPGGEDTIFGDGVARLPHVRARGHRLRERLERPRPARRDPEADQPSSSPTSRTSRSTRWTRRCRAGWDSYAFFAISPRHLEAVVTKTAQVLVEGSYSGVLEPERHYIPVRRDFSQPRRGTRAPARRRGRRGDDRARLPRGVPRAAATTSRCLRRPTVAESRQPRETGRLRCRSRSRGASRPARADAIDARSRFYPAVAVAPASGSRSPTRWSRHREARRALRCRAARGRGCPSPLREVVRTSSCSACSRRSRRVLGR